MTYPLNETWFRLPVDWTIDSTSPPLTELVQLHAELEDDWLKSHRFISPKEFDDDIEKALRRGLFEGDSGKARRALGRAFPLLCLAIGARIETLSPVLRDLFFTQAIFTSTELLVEADDPPLTPMSITIFMRVVELSAQLPPADPGVFVVTGLADSYSQHIKEFSDSLRALTPALEDKELLEPSRIARELSRRLAANAKSVSDWLNALGELELTHQGIATLNESFSVGDDFEFPEYRPGRLVALRCHATSLYSLLRGDVDEARVAAEAGKDALIEDLAEWGFRAEDWDRTQYLKLMASGAEADIAKGEQPLTDDMIRMLRQWTPCLSHDWMDGVQAHNRDQFNETFALQMVIRLLVLSRGGPDLVPGPPTDPKIRVLFDMALQGIGELNNLRVEQSDLRQSIEDAIEKPGLLPRPDALATGQCSDLNEYVEIFLGELVQLNQLDTQSKSELVSAEVKFRELQSMPANSDDERRLVAGLLAGAVLREVAKIPASSALPRLWRFKQLRAKAQHRETYPFFSAVELEEMRALALGVNSPHGSLLQQAIDRRALPKL